MKTNKKGQIGTSNIQKYILLVVMIVVLFLVLVELLPEAETAGDALNASGVPLGSLFASGGVLFVIVMAGVLLLVVKGAMPKK